MSEFKRIPPEQAQALREQGAVVVDVRDRGTGFTEEMLAALGTPYRSSKNRPGGGLGLFLVVNVVRKLGGTVVAQNIVADDEVTGALVTLNLPLATLSPGERHGG